MKLAAVVAAALIAGACTPAPLQLTVPAEIEWAAAVTREPPRATPLSTRDALIYAAAPQARVLLYGWTGAELEGVLPADGVPLALTGACGPRLPRPRWIREVTADGMLLDADAGAPDLTGAWLADRCPPGALGALRDPSVATEATQCAARATARPPCGFTVELTGQCALSSTTANTIEGRVNLDGSLCLVPESGCAPTGARGEYRCTKPVAATVTLDTPARYTVDTITVIPPAALDARGIAPPMRETPSDSNTFFGDEGFLFDFVIAGGKVIVSSESSRPAVRAVWKFCNGWPSTAAPRSQLDVYDAETLAHEGTFSAPPCLRRLAPSPGSRTSFFAADYGTYAPNLYEMDLGGRVLRRRAVPLGLAPEDPRYFPWVVDLFATPATHKVALLIGADAREVVQGAVPVVLRPYLERLAVFEGPQLTWTATVWTSSVSRVQAMARIAPGAVVMLDESNGEVIRRRIDPGGPPISTSPHRIDATSPNLTLGKVVHLDDRGVSLVTSQGARPGLYALSSSDELDSKFIGSPIRSVYPFEAMPSPQEPGRVVVASLAWSVPYAEGSGPQDPAGCFDATRAASLPCAALQLLDVDDRRLSEPVVVGYGVPSRMRADEKGRLWILLPWSAQLVRVTPRP